LITRTDTTAGAVDAFTVGDELITRVETQSFLGINQTMPVTYPPVRQIVTVENLTTPVVYTEEVDYEVVTDTSGVAGSTRAVEGVRFLPDDAVSPVPPTVSDLIRITYTNNNLVRRMQATFEQEDVQVFGRDLLFREGERVDLILEASLHVVTGFSTVTVPAAVEAALLDYINTLNLGDDIEESDLQLVVRTISGVDNFIITRLVRDPVTTGTADIAIEKNEYARITAGPDLAITLI